MRVQHLPLIGLLVLVLAVPGTQIPAADNAAKVIQPAAFHVRSANSGNWSNPKTWNPPRVPKTGDLVQISRGTRVVYDVKSDDVLRLVQVVGTLTFARDRDTLLNVGILKVQNSDHCSEAGFACDFETVNEFGEPHAPPEGEMPALEVGTLAEPIPAQFTARIRLHYLDGMDKNDAPALACCSSRMDLHGAPLSRTWVKLGRDVKPGDATVELAETVTGWQVGHEVVVTGTEHSYDNQRPGSETRTITKIDGATLTLDKPLAASHSGSGDYRSEVANLSRNVIVESADPAGVRGHTVYHRFSRGGISYARFAHLGKKDVLGRYSIHFHLLDDSNRGGSVAGASIVDSHNRWITIHGTHYLVVRDCVGYQSVGHGYFLEDGTEVYNVLDRNLGIQARQGQRLPKQVLPFDPNDGAAFWWANGRNTLVRNVACENDRYGYRFDSQKRSNFDSNLLVRQPDGQLASTDIRTLPFYRFEHNETHTEGLYGIAVAGTDRAGPDTKHPHVLKNLKIWQVHYGLRAQLPTMWIENVAIDHAAYGIYRPEYENHVYKNIRIASTNTEPFNRALDDQSQQYGRITVDGLQFAGVRSGGQMPLIQISDHNPGGQAESHFRNVTVEGGESRRRRPLVNRGGGPRPKPNTPQGVPIYLHDYFGAGKTAKVVSTAARDFGADGLEYRSVDGLTGDESRAAEVSDVKFPTLLEPTDDQPPATVITSPARGVDARLDGGKLIIRGTTTDNVRTKRVTVNGVAAQDVDYNFHQWEVTLSGIKPGKLTLEATAEDAVGNRELTPHKLTIEVR